MSWFPDGLLRAGSRDLAATSRVLGVFLLAGAVFVAASLVLPHPDGADVPGLSAIAGVIAVIGSGSILGAKHARAWMVHTVLAAGTTLICSCAYLAGASTGIYSSMFIWVVLVAAGFFSRRALAGHFGWVMVAGGLTVALGSGPASPLVVSQFVLGAFVLAISALVMSEIVAAARAAEVRLHTEARERERLQGELRHLADHDPLTDLPNRRFFEKALARELARAKRHGAPLCVVALDLDGFKQYNDSHGHAAGDDLLKAAANAWGGSLRAEDMLARFGGDEFVALLPDCPLAEAERAARRLCDGMPLKQRCSTGVACWDGTESAEHLLGRADSAMYESKQRPTV